MFSEKFNTIEYLERVLSRELGIKNVKWEIDLKFRLKDYSKETIDKIIQCVKKYIASNYKPMVSISADELKLKSGELENFIDLEFELKKEGVPLYLTEEQDKYSLEQTIDAYLNCKSYADFVKSTNASPLEKYLMIYGFVTDRLYKESEGKIGDSRNLISILNGDEIVCVGYAKLLKYLCNEVGIQCECQSLEVVYKDKQDNENGRHQNNIIYLKDEKYGIDGYYYADACWDAVTKNEKAFLKYTYALVPVCDVEKMNSKFLNFEVTNFLYNEYSEVELIEDSEKLKSFANFMGIPLKSKSLNDKNEPPVEYFERLSKYMMVIFDALKNNRIPSDILSNEKFEKIPRRFYPEFLVAMAMLDPPRIDIIQNTINEMKEFYKSGGVISEKSNNLGLYETYGYENIYNKLQEHEDIDSIFNVWALETYYEVYQNLPRIWLATEKMKASSKPIDKTTFANALFESFKARGLNSAQARKITSIAIAKTDERTKLHFSKESTSCFAGDDVVEFAALDGK